MEKQLLALGLLMLVGTLYQIQAPATVDLSQQFKAYENKFNKKYTDTERAYRYQVYLASMAEAEAKNARNGGAKFGETQFTDMTNEEFAATFLTLKVEQAELEAPRTSFPKKATYTPIDWRSRGAVTPIKNQGACGSCWTFGTTGVLEGFFKITEGVLPSLSEQQLLDCSTWADLNFGCNGGMPSRALNHVKRQGITTEEAYPYTAEQGTCATKGGAYKISGHTSLEATEDALLGALEKQPVSVAVDATNWKDYVEGTFLASQCESTLNHAVLAVGFTQSTLIVKNSWGTGWGEQGYINLELGKNACGVLDATVVPN